MLETKSVHTGKPTLQLKAALLFVSLFFLTFISFGQVRSSVDTTLIRIGEEIQYTIEVEADSTALVSFPEGQSFTPLEVIESYAIDTSYAETKMRLIKKYGLTQFDSGKYTLPSQRVFIDDRSFPTDSAFIEVRDVPVDTIEQQMFDIKPAIEVNSPPFNIVKLVYWLLPILLLLGALVYFLFRRKKRREAAKKQLPPYEEAISALQQLDGSGLLKDQRNKEYYSALTEIVKRYLDREVDDHALESTSDELIERLQLHKDSGHFDFDNETIKKLDAVFKRADLVKFAKMRHAEGQANADRHVIEEIINETKEVLPEPSEEELRQNEEYLAHLAKRRKRKQWIQAVAGVFTLLILSVVVYGAVTGFDNLRDKIIGNEMRDLAEGRWYKSEYGSPAVIVETPEILVRKQIELPEELKGVITSSSYFEYGNFQEAFYISVNTSIYNPQVTQGQEIDLNISMESALKEIEKTGATNMIVKQENFSTESGIEGLKAYGDFNIKYPNGKISGEKAAYEVLLFKQNGGLQLVSIVYKQQDFYATQVKDRVIRSVELEITQNQGTKPKEQE